MRDPRRAVLCLAALLGFARAWAGEVPPPAPPKTPKVTVRLHDGSILVGKPEAEELKFRTEYGLLTLPLGQIQRVVFGVTVQEVDPRAVAKWVEQLGSANYPEREAAHEALIEQGPKVVPALKVSEAKAEDPEVKQRIATLLASIARAAPDAPQHDRIFARQLKASGKVELGELSLETRFGLLKVGAKDIESLEFDTLKSALRENFDRKIAGWDLASDGETRWHPTRRRAANGGMCLRCALPDQATYGNNVHAAATSPSMDLTALEHPELRYQWLAFYEEGADSFLLEISTDNGDNWTQLFAHPQSTGWEERRVPLSSYRNAQVKIRFSFASDDSEVREGLYLDNVTVGEGSGDE
ncbi:MAG: immune inhibitor A [Planctomycetota bacterium]|nr:immune inhibitor A [Planctomycetota bacterium]